MKYKTRDGSDEKGKINLYFCAPPKDRERYFDALANDFFYFDNFVIRYHDEETIDKTDLEFLANAVDLVIVPVTESLLFENSFARDIEIPYFRSVHMPILPFLFDPSLFDRANEFFGNVQVLMPNADDRTALGYYDKLHRFLKTILIKDELTARIKKAFPKQVFLSYRKCDREIALLFMKTMHRIKEFRRIGIWFDEFLTPTENFDKEIQNAIDQSDGIALMITPNTVAEGNYILRKEYPHAVTAKKPILPVVMKSTDEAKIRNCFSELTKPLDFLDPNFAERLSEAFRFLVSSDACGNSPENDYLIGMAYLYGINTERNCDYARELIEGAAARGLCEAAYQLVMMYSCGAGVERNRTKQNYWSTVYIDLCKKAYSEEPLTENGIRYAESLLYFSAFLSEQSEFEKSDKVFDRAMKFLKGKESVKEYLPVIASAASDYGVFCIHIKQWAKVEYLFSLALSVYECLQNSEAEFSEELLSKIALAQYHLGLLALSRKRADAETVQRLSVAAQTFRTLSKASPEKYSGYYAECLGNLAMAYKSFWIRTGNRVYFTEAEKYLGGSIRIANDRIEKAPAQYEPIYAKNCAMLAELYMYAEDCHEKSLLFYSHAEQYFRAFTAENPEKYALEYAKLVVNYANLCKITGDIPRAIPLIETALPLFEEVYRRHPNVYAVEYVKIKMVAGTFLHKNGDLKRANECFEAALKVFEGKMPNDFRALEAYAEVAHAYADLKMENGVRDVAEPYYVAALQIFQILQKETGMYDYYDIPIRRIKAIIEDA